MKNKILLVLSDNRGISTFPAVYQSAIELKKRGDIVGILTNSICDDLTLNKYFDEYKILNTNYNWIYEANLVTQFILSNNYNIIIAFEPRDAINCSIASIKKKNTEFYYYNLEIYEREKKKKEKILLDEFNIKKILEKIYAHKCRAIVIQDELRKKISKKHGIKKKKTFLIPNSYYENFQESSKVMEYNKKLRIIYSGSLEEWSIKPILDNKSLIDNDKYSITLSGWSRDRYVNEFIRKKIHNNLIINLNKLNTEEYKELIYRNDVGLVWYSDEMSENVYNIGRSSGKYYMYLSCCKPVIVKNLPGIAEEVINNGFGIVIDSLSDLEWACEKMYHNYYEYYNNIKKVYKQIIEYSIVSKKFFDYISFENKIQLH